MYRSTYSVSTSCSWLLSHKCIWSKNVFIFSCAYLLDWNTHTHTHTHIYIYIYISFWYRYLFFTEPVNQTIMLQNPIREVMGSILGRTLAVLTEHFVVPDKTWIRWRQLRSTFFLIRYSPYTNYSTLYDMIVSLNKTLKYKIKRIYLVATLVFTLFIQLFYVVEVLIFLTENIDVFIPLGNTLSGVYGSVTNNKGLWNWRSDLLTPSFTISLNDNRV
jgi:hypothetical protein